MQRISLHPAYCASPNTPAPTLPDPSPVTKRPTHSRPPPHLAKGGHKLEEGGAPDERGLFIGGLPTERFQTAQSNQTQGSAAGETEGSGPEHACSSRGDCRIKTKASLMSSCQLQRRKPPLPPFMPLPLQPVGKRAGAKGRGFDDRAAEQRITAHLSGAKRRSQKPAMACQRTAQAAVHSLAALSRAAAANNLQPCSPGRLLVGPAGLAHLYFLLALVSLEARSFSRSRLPSSSFSLLEAGGRGTTP